MRFRDFGHKNLGLRKLAKLDCWFYIRNFLIIKKKHTILPILEFLDDYTIPQLLRTTVHEWHSHSLSSGIILVVVVKNLLVYLFRLHIRKTKPRNITAIKKLKSQTLQGCTIHVLLLKFSPSQGWSGLCMCEVKGRKGSMRASERTSQDLKSRSGCRAVSTIVY